LAGVSRIGDAKKAFSPHQWCGFGMVRGKETAFLDAPVPSGMDLLITSMLLHNTAGFARWAAGLNANREPFLKNNIRIGGISSQSSFGTVRQNPLGILSTSFASSV
jgi:hypothetical protein